jgi:hypothetical protein
MIFCLLLVAAGYCWLLAAAAGALAACSLHDARIITAGEQ